MNSGCTKPEPHPLCYHGLLNSDSMASTDPADVDISKSSGVTIIWKDGHRSEYQLQYLRDRCPCATCGKKEAQPAAPVANPLQLFKPRARIQDVESVGRYALRFFWSDGHSTGIYSFDYLRSICPCAECSSGQNHPTAAVTQG